jgi:hypothetical protein
VIILVAAILMIFSLPVLDGTVKVHPKTHVQYSDLLCNPKPINGP